MIFVGVAGWCCLCAVGFVYVWQHRVTPPMVAQPHTYHMSCDLVCCTAWMCETSGCWWAALPLPSGLPGALYFHHATVALEED